MCFNLDLKTTTEDFLTCSGKAFHSFGVASEKAQYPNSFSRGLGIKRSNWSVDLSALWRVLRLDQVRQVNGCTKCTNLDKFLFNGFCSLQLSLDHLDELGCSVLCSNVAETSFLNKLNQREGERVGGLERSGNVGTVPPSGELMYYFT